MNGTNVIFLNGTVVADPELKVFDSGNKVATLRMATNQTYTKNGERVQESQFHTVKFWNKLADTISQYVQKGSNINVIGQLKYRDYTDPNGAKRQFAEIHAVSPSTFSFLPNNNSGNSEGKQNNGGGPSNQQPQQQQQSVEQSVQNYANSGQQQATNSDFVNSDDEDDLPF